MELPTEVHEQMTALCSQGDAYSDGEDFSQALHAYWAAWDLLPDPKTEWNAATWILAAIGDANFNSQDFTAGRDNLTMAMHCPGAIGNPFIHMRLGQCQYELGDLDRAADELTRAFMLAGDDLFEGEAKYLSFLKSRLEPPLGGW